MENSTTTKAHEMKSNMAERLQSAGELLVDAKDTAEKQIEHRPILAVGIGLGIGLGLGYLLARLIHR